MALPLGTHDWLGCLCSWNAPGDSLPSRTPLPAPVWHQLQDSLGSQAAAEGASSGREAGPSSQTSSGTGLSSRSDNGSSGTPDVWLRVSGQSLLCLQDVPGQPSPEIMMRIVVPVPACSTFTALVLSPITPAACRAMVPSAASDSLRQCAAALPGFGCAAPPWQKHGCQLLECVLQARQGARCW